MFRLKGDVLSRRGVKHSLNACHVGDPKIVHEELPVLANVTGVSVLISFSSVKLPPNGPAQYGSNQLRIPVASKLKPSIANRNASTGRNDSRGLWNIAR